MKHRNCDILTAKEARHGSRRFSKVRHLPRHVQIDVDDLMPIRCVRNFWYEVMRLIGDEWWEDDPAVAQALVSSGNCVDGNWQPTIKPWPVVLPPAPLPPSGP